MVAIKDGALWRPKSYHVFNVTSIVQSRAGHLQYPIVTEYDNLFDIWDALTEDGSLYCAKLIADRSVDAPANVKRIVSAQAIILNKAGYVIIEPPYYDIPPAEVEAVLQDFDWGMAREPEAE